MTVKRRASDRAAAVFRLLYGAQGWEYGQEIAERLELRRPTVYAILKRLEEDGLAVSQQELMGPKELGRPRRTYYRLTERGRESAQEGGI